MIIRFPESTMRQVKSVVVNNRTDLLYTTAWATIVYVLHNYAGIEGVEVPTTAVALQGSALAIILGFRNNSAYDRWWEARKIWGGVVNVSRSFSATFLAATPDLSADERRRVVYRHLAYINAVRIQLRERPDEWVDIEPFLEADELETIERAKNRATQLASTQAVAMSDLKRRGVVDAFDHKKLVEYIERMYDLQGMAERIKKTVFPAFYDYFTHVFLLLFVVTLPLGLVKDMGWHAIPLCVAISFVFAILEKTARASEDPLDARSSGTPMGALCRVIEIDLRQMLGETELPLPWAVKTTRHGSTFLD
ncbi:MAG: hypothetical protein KDA24_07335 [Deltaproteobacteria bacterium]|nr:hypothetical protein [Deltaproteobacteria bacterium]